MTYILYDLVFYLQTETLNVSTEKRKKVRYPISYVPVYSPQTGTSLQNSLMIF